MRGRRDVDCRSRAWELGTYLFVCTGTPDMTSLYQLAEAKRSDDTVTKPLAYYGIYDRTLAEESLEPTSILEIGVHKGESTRILATRFPAARIVAIDLYLMDIDFSGFPNITYLQCDQTDGDSLATICRNHFPAGIDLVIEDASHIGHFSRLTFDSVFPHLKSSGLYIVEDWGTGYWPGWVDGAPYRDQGACRRSPRIRKPMPSHAYGMVGFVKSLVDFTAIADITDRRSHVGSPIARLLVLLSRSTFLRGALERMPWLKARCLALLEPSQKSSERPAAIQPSVLPRLASVKYYQGVCVARKA